MTWIGWAYGVAIAWAIGLAVVRASIGPGHRDLATLGIAACIGLVLTAMLRYVLQAFALSHPLVIVVADHLLLCGALGSAWALGRGARAGADGRDPGPPRTVRSARLAWALAAIVIVVAFRTTAVQIGAHPFGSWDAIALWSPKAHVLYAGGARWRDLLQSTNWPDYPPLLPLTVARLAAYAGEWSTNAPLGASILFSAIACGLVAGVIGRERGPWVALVGLAVFLAPEPVRVNAGAACADVPLATLELAAVACLWRAMREDPRSGARQALLAGMLSAGALCTKNDALPFAASIAIGLPMGAWALERRHGPGAVLRPGAALLAWGAGALPLVLVLVHFKLQMSVPPWLVADRSWADVLRLVLDPVRYVVVWSATTTFLQVYLPISSAILLAIAVATSSTLRDGRFWIPTGVIAVALVAQLGAYFLVYVASPYAIVWHVVTSATRLALHVWPSAVVLVFLTIGGFAVGRTASRCWS
jgi:hypothetical protein